MEDKFIQDLKNVKLRDYFFIFEDKIFFKYYAFMCVSEIFTKVENLEQK